MIDIHSHILPGVDDGAKTLAESIDMLKMAVDQGVTTQVLTPHIHIGRYNNTKQGLQKAFNLFEAEIKNRDIPIELKLAAEVRIGHEIMQLVSQDQIPWLGKLNGKKVFLLEFPRIDVPHGSDNLVRWLIQQNVMPLIVHPERNRTFVDNPRRLQTFIDLGCPLQITASSLMGKFGADVQSIALNLLESDSVFAIASDCHNLKGRSPDLGFSVNELLKQQKRFDYESLVSTNPSKILNAKLAQ